MAMVDPVFSVFRFFSLSSALGSFPRTPVESCYRLTTMMAVLMFRAGG